MPNAVELVKIIKKTAVDAVEASKPVNILFGTVINVSPLKIITDQQMQLGEAQLVLTRNVTEHIIEMTVDHETEDYELEIDTTHNHGAAEFDAQTSHKHVDSAGGETETTEIETTHSHPDAGRIYDLKHRHKYKGRKLFTVHKGLVVGEKVLLLRQQGGQKYIVMDRIK